MPRGAGTEYDETKYPSKSEEMAARFNEKINRENYQSGFTDKNVNMSGTPQGIKTLKNWMTDAAGELGISTRDVFNTPNKFSSDIEVSAGNEGAYGNYGWYNPAGVDYDWERWMSDDSVTTFDEISSPRPARLTLTKEGVRNQNRGNDTLGHETWHAGDIMFDQEEPSNYLLASEDTISAPGERGVDLSTDSEYSRENLGLNDNLNLFGGPNGAKEWSAFKHSFDFLPDQWSVQKKRGGFAGQNNDVYVKSNQMRDSLVRMYMDSENFQQLPEESRGPLALAMATALSSQEYDENLKYVLHPTQWSVPVEGNPHIDKRKVSIPYEDTDYSYLDHPDERAARFIGGAFGKGTGPDWLFGTKDSNEQYPSLKEALGKWKMSGGVTSGWSIDK